MGHGGDSGGESGVAPLQVWEGECSCWAKLQTWVVLEGHERGASRRVGGVCLKANFDTSPAVLFLEQCPRKLLLELFKLWQTDSRNLSRKMHVLNVQIFL